MNDPLEALEAAYENVEEAETKAEEVEEAEIIEEEIKPPGYKSYDEWIAEGKDPDRYKGKKAYEDEYNRIQEVKLLKDEVKTLSGTLKTTVDAIHDRESRAEARHRKELEAALAKAKELGDTEAAISTLEQLNELKPVVREAQVHPVLNDFINRNTSLVDPDLKKEFARIYNGKLKADGVGQYDELSEAAIAAYASSAMNGVKTLYPDRFKSPLNNRPAPKTPALKPGPTKIDVNQAIRDVKIESTLSPQNRDAASEIYDLIRAKDPKQAEAFAKRVMENV